MTATAVLDLDLIEAEQELNSLFDTSVVIVNFVKAFRPDDDDEDDDYDDDAVADDLDEDEWVAGEDDDYDLDEDDDEDW
jgi:hypothetical protein